MFELQHDLDIIWRAHARHALALRVLHLLLTVIFFSVLFAMLFK